MNKSNKSFEKIYNEIKETEIRDLTYSDENIDNDIKFQPGFVKFISNKFLLSSSSNNPELTEKKLKKIDLANKFEKEIESIVNIDLINCSETEIDSNFHSRELFCKNIVSDAKRVFESFVSTTNIVQIKSANINEITPKKLFNINKESESNDVQVKLPKSNITISSKSLNPHKSKFTSAKSLVFNACDFQKPLISPPKQLYSPPNSDIDEYDEPIEITLDIFEDYSSNMNYIIPKSILKTNSKATEVQVSYLSINDKLKQKDFQIVKNLRFADLINKTHVYENEDYWNFECDDSEDKVPTDDMKNVNWGRESQYKLINESANNDKIEFKSELLF